MATWADISEIVTGLILQKRLPCNVINPKSLIPPYDEILIQYKKDQSIESLIEMVGLDPIQNALHAEQSVNGTGNLADWIKLLEKSKIRYSAGYELEKASHKLQSGEEIDWSILTSIASKAQSGIGSGFTPLSEVEAMEVPFKKTGFKAIDIHFGGLPAVGQILIAGSPGSGKTTFMLELAACWVKTWKEDIVVIFTLEMLKEELKMRLVEVFHLEPDQLARIVVEDMPMSPAETVSKAATVEKLGLVLVDFADLLIDGETSESAMANIYRTYMLGAKALRCPIAVLCQLSRNYTGGIPRPQHIRYTSLAEALAWAIIMLYNPNTNWYPADDDPDDEIMPRIPDYGYIIGWKFRGGFRVHKDDSPGAIQLPFKGGNGWHPFDSGKWFPVKSPAKKGRRKRLT